MASVLGFRRSFKKLLKDKKAELKNIVGVAVGLFVAAILLPVALNQIYSWTPSTSVPQAVVTVVQTLMPVMAVLAVALIFIGKIRTK
ncbi:MAG: hypothetical protein QXR81_08105 [Candidatus Nezhaarchaeales archaeon]